MRRRRVGGALRRPRSKAKWASSVTSRITSSPSALMWNPSSIGETLISWRDQSATSTSPAFMDNLSSVRSMTTCIGTSSTPFSLSWAS